MKPEISNSRKPANLQSPPTDLHLTTKNSQSTSIKNGTCPTFEEAMLSSIETPEEASNRKKSHLIIHTIGFMMGIGFSIIITGVYPYLKLLLKDNNVSKVNVGWVVAATPLGQMIASPVMGYMANKLGSIRTSFMVTIVIFCLGNLIYAVLPYTMGWWHESAYHIMVFARFLVGISSGNSSLCRYYIVSSTTTKERTSVLSVYAGAVSLGYIVGPLIQMVQSLLIPDNLLKYRASGYSSILMGGIAGVLLMWRFQEYNIAAKERDVLKKLQSDTESNIIPKRDLPALIGVMFSFFIFQFVYVELETVLEPFVQDHYGWCNDLAVISVGLMLSLTGVLLAGAFWIAVKTANYMDERMILLFLGLGVTAAGVFLMLPWAGQKMSYCPTSEVIPVSIKQDQLLRIVSQEKFSYTFIDEIRSVNLDYTLSDEIFSSLCPNVTYCLGCPSEQKWCENSPRLPLIQLIMAISIISIGYSFGYSMANSILSKMLGPKPQGTWMGFLTATGSFARVLGPIFSSYVYTELGTTVTFSITLGIVMAGVICHIIFHKRLVPMKLGHTILPQV